MIDWTLFASTFTLVFVSELPDKTAFAALLLGSQGSPLAVFAGAAFAFLIQSAVAVSLGSVLGRLPHQWVHLAAGLLFLGFAVASWVRKDEEADEEKEFGHVISPGSKFLKIAWKAFAVIFVAEWGDLTQLATASLAAKYNAPASVFLGSVSALWLVTAIAITLGHHAHKLIHPQRLKRIASFAFAIVGAYFLWSWATGN